MEPHTLFIDKVEELLETRKTDVAYYLLYLDFIDFQSINHYYGTSSGDKLLKTFADYLSKSSEVLVTERTFADHFLCFCCTPSETTMESVLDSCNDFIIAFLRATQPYFAACKLDISCGVCSLSDTLPAAIDNANFARKEAKKGSERVVLYDPEMRESALKQFNIEKSIHEAFKQNQFCFYLQPKVSITNGKIIGAEALARRIDETGNVISPDAFLSQMEVNGTIIDLDMLICHQVCSFLADRMQKGLPVVRVSVNLSRLHTRNPDSAHLFHSIAQEYQISPDLLEFELTETILLDEFSQTKYLIDHLRAYGYHVSIDDFGSGYAGINIWQELDFDILKLDKKFLSDVPQLKTRNEAIVPNIINIAHRLRIDVVCEGVETEEQCQYLLQLGCTNVQGYYFSKPVTPETFCSVLENQNGVYPLPFLKHLTSTPSAEDALQNKQKDTRFNFHQYAATALLCVLALCFFISAIISQNSIDTQKQFSKMIEENLAAYTDTQKKSTAANINELKTSLETLALLIGQNDDDAFINAYLQALNNAPSNQYTFEYTSFDSYQKDLLIGKVRPSRTETFHQLQQNKSTISNVMYSASLGNIYYVALDVPVFRDNTFQGALRGIFNAENLVSMSEYPPAQGSIVASFITNADGRIIQVRTNNPQESGDLCRYLANQQAPDDVIAAVQSNFQNKKTETEVIYLGTYEQKPYYLAMTDLAFNDWKLVICLEAHGAAIYSQQIVQDSSHYIIFTILTLLFGSGILIVIFIRIQKKISMEKERYLLLEQFSDTVLFDYDYNNDTFRFTSNAPKLLRLHGIIQKGFLKNFQQKFIYSADMAILTEVLTGRASNSDQGVRVRLLRPDGVDYFWSLIQYQYIYKKNELTSIIGKITDIDSQKMNEDSLLALAKTDGLTGLKNKSAIEAEISKQLLQVESALFFMIDVDDFKACNDLYGHSCGDQILKFIADCMQTVFRSTDLLGRIGGDEMVALLVNTNNLTLAEKKVTLLFQHLEKKMNAAHLPPISISIGIARYPEDGNNFVALYHAADQAMYRSKKKGKDQFSFFHEGEDFSV